MPERIRTSDPKFRKLVLYPAELRALDFFIYYSLLSVISSLEKKTFFESVLFLLERVRWQDMDSFELNKIAAAVLIALIVVKGVDLISRTLISPTVLSEPAFKIAGAPMPSSHAHPTVPEGPAPIEPLLAAANLKKGEEIFRKCTSCHTVDKGGANRIGPNLFGIVDAPKAKHPEYSYSSVLKEKGGAWTYQELNLFLYNPRAYLPGTKMSFAGIKNTQDRADLIAYLRGQSASPCPLPSQ